VKATAKKSPSGQSLEARPCSPRRRGAIMMTQPPL